MLKARTAPWRLTDVGCAAALEEEEEEEEAPPAEAGVMMALPWGPGGHICAGSFGICAKGAGPKGERGAG